MCSGMDLRRVEHQVLELSVEAGLAGGFGDGGWKGTDARGNSSWGADWVADEGGPQKQGTSPGFPSQTLQSPSPAKMTCEAY